MEDTNELSPQESLHLIQTMINKTKVSVAADSFYFLLWGWLVFGCCAVEYFLKVYLAYPNHYIVWWLMPIGGVISSIYGARQAKKQKVKSFIEEALDYLWIAIAISFITLVVINIFGNGWPTAFTYYILLYAIGTFITGKLIQFQPLVIGGLLNFIFAAISIRLDYDHQLLLGAVAILTSYIIPGHLLRKKYSQKK
jgi:hypothetical protein